MHWRRERTALYLHQAQNQAQSQATDVKDEMLRLLPKHGFRAG